MSTTISTGVQNLIATRFCTPASEGKDRIRVELSIDYSRSVVLNRQEWETFSKAVQQSFDDFKTEPERVCNKFVIEGTIIDDSLQKGASFDAEPFFQQASFDDLKAMMLVGWGVDIVVDKVPQYIRTTNQEINKLLEVFESSPENEPGIDHVYNTILDENDVEKWLMQNRPEWHKQLIQILDKHLKRT